MPDINKILVELDGVSPDQPRPGGHSQRRTSWKMRGDRIALGLHQEARSGCNTPGGRSENTRVLHNGRGSKTDVCGLPSAHSTPGWFGGINGVAKRWIIELGIGRRGSGSSDHTRGVERDLEIITCRGRDVPISRDAL